MRISISEIITATGGAVITGLLIYAVSFAIEPDAEILMALFIMLYHGFGALVLLPFLLRAYMKSDIGDLFNKIVLIESGTSSFLVFVLVYFMLDANNINLISDGIQALISVSIFIVAGILELFPFLLYRRNRHKILGRQEET